MTTCGVMVQGSFMGISIIWPCSGRLSECGLSPGSERYLASRTPTDLSSLRSSCSQSQRANEDYPPRKGPSTPGRCLDSLSPIRTRPESIGFGWLGSAGFHWAQKPERRLPSLASPGSRTPPQSIAAQTSLARYLTASGFNALPGQRFPANVQFRRRSCIQPRSLRTDRSGRHPK